MLKNNVANKSIKLLDLDACYIECNRNKTEYHKNGWNDITTSSIVMVKLQVVYNKPAVPSPGLTWLDSILSMNTYIL